MGKQVVVVAVTVLDVAHKVYRIEVCGAFHFCHILGVAGVYLMTFEYLQ